MGGTKISDLAEEFGLSWEEVAEEILGELQFQKEVREEKKIERKKYRLFELSYEFNIPYEELVNALKAVGFNEEITNFTEIDEDTLEKAKQYLSENKSGEKKVSKNNNIDKNFNLIGLNKLNHVLTKLKKIENTDVIPKYLKNDIRKIIKRKEEIDKKVDLIEKDLISLNIAFVGEFSSGKSSIINSILGEEIIPTGDEPMTSVVSVFKYGDKKYIEAEYENEIITLTEEEFSLIKHKSEGEAKKKLRIDPNKINKLFFYYPNPLLKKFVIIDTPGFSTANYQTDDEKTLKVINEEADVLFWAIDVNQGTINESSLKILRKIKEKRKDLPIFIIANKVDTKGKPNSKKVKEIIQSISEKSGINDVYPYSAKMILESIKEDNYLNKTLEKIKELILSYKFPIFLDRETKKRLKKEITQIKIIFNNSNNEEEISIEINDFSEWISLRENLISKLEEIRNHPKEHIQLSTQREIEELIYLSQTLLDDIKNLLNNNLFENLQKFEETFIENQGEFLKKSIERIIEDLEKNVEKEIYEIIAAEIKNNTSLSKENLKEKIEFIFNKNINTELKAFLEAFYEVINIEINNLNLNFKVMDEKPVKDVKDLLDNFNKLINTTFKELNFQEFLYNLENLIKEEEKNFFFEIEQSYKFSVETSSMFISKMDQYFRDSDDISQAIKEVSYMNKFLFLSTFFTELKKSVEEYIFGQTQIVQEILEKKRKEIKNLKKLVEDKYGY